MPGLLTTGVLFLQDCLPGVSMPCPHCAPCGDPLVHLVQVYCPLVDSPYHRVINVFACARPECWGNSESWRVLRSQYLALEEDRGRECKVTEEFSMTTSDWCDEADDWGIADPVTLGSSPERLPETTRVCSPSADPLVAAQVISFQGLSLQEPCQPRPVSDRRLFHSHTFRPFYISVVEENDYTAAECSDHDQRLLQEYQSREGLDIQRIASEGCESSSKTETYEKSNVRHGDQIFLKFMKQIACCPSQILRYSRNGVPLFISSPPPNYQSAIPCCQACGGRRVFEFQLMPALVTMLTGTGTDSLAVEFGTALVYTCELSCWSPGNQIPMEEYPVVQADPDQKLFR
uniref:Programmed cell death 2-like n=1 Tax=Callorhinchus milii TaxID=7868 RepID=A0A4W3J980_CALMI